VTESQIIDEFGRVGRWLHEKNLLAAFDGNFSYRCDDGSIWITASGFHKGLQAPRLAHIDFEGSPLKGEPSSESLLHCKIYQLADQAKFVIHAHPPSAIAWSIAHPELRELPCDHFAEVILAMGAIPVAPYAKPGGKELAGSVAPWAAQNRAIILARHGAVAWGESLIEAVNGIERIEHAAMVSILASSLGGTTRLPQSEIEWLKERRKEIGCRTL
jgi:L-fuculose-phosphate aldolase